MYLNQLSPDDNPALYNPDTKYYLPPTVLSTAKMSLNFGMRCSTVVPNKPTLTEKNLPDQKGKVHLLPTVTTQQALINTGLPRHRRIRWVRQAPR